VSPFSLAVGHVDEHMEMGMLAYYIVHGSMRSTRSVPDMGHSSMLYMLLLAPATVAAAVAVVYVRRRKIQSGRQSLLNE
jgi:hypothetical protein